MGFRFRKSFKIAPGVKLNVNKKSIGLSIGGKGGRVSVNSKGKVTKSVSIPRTGISYTDTHTVGTNSKTKTKKQNNSNDNYRTYCYRYRFINRICFYHNRLFRYALLCKI